VRRIGHGRSTLMLVAAKVKRFLNSHRVTYRVLNHERTETLAEAAHVLGINRSQVVQAILLKACSEVVLALLPLGFRINLPSLIEQTNRNFEILSPEESDIYFDDCEPSSHPPFGEAYGLACILDRSIEKLQVIYFESGSHTALIQLSIEDFQFLTSGAPSLSFAVPYDKNEVCLSIYDIEKKPVTICLPELPLLAQEILEIARESSDTGVLALSDLISKDAVMHEHFLQCAGFYSAIEGGMVPNSIQEVIKHIIGFKTVSHIAVGIAAGRVFRIPDEGPLGLRAFWKQALFSGLLAKKIAEKIPSQYEVDSDLSYVLGFFHNFGYLLLGHRYPPEFRLLNKWIVMDPKTSVDILEKRLLGMGQARAIVGCGHAQLGSWLMHHWGMPEVIVQTTRHHHKFDYEGEYASYVALLQLTSHLLKTVGIGDGSFKLNQYWLNRFSLTRDKVEDCLTSLFLESQDLDQMANVLAN